MMVEVVYKQVSYVNTRRNRFFAFMKRQKALDRLCLQLAGGHGMQGVVVFGAEVRTRYNRVSAGMLGLLPKPNEGDCQELEALYARGCSTRALHFAEMLPLYVLLFVGQIADG